MKFADVIDIVINVTEGILKVAIPFAMFIMVIDMMLDIVGKSEVNFEYLIPINFLVLVVVFHRITKR